MAKNLSLQQPGGPEGAGGFPILLLASVDLAIDNQINAIAIIS